MKVKLILIALFLSLITLYTNAQNTKAFKVSTNGGSKYAIISVPMNSNLRVSGSWTLEAWVNRNQFAIQNFVIEAYDSPGNTANGGFALRLDNGKIQAFQFAGSNGSSFVTGTTTIPHQEWHHIAATLDVANQTLNVYLDGVLEASATSVTPLQNNNNDIKIGARGDNGFIHSIDSDFEIDNVKIWNFAKTPTQIQADTFACLTGSESGLLAWFDFENVTTVSLIDKSNNSNDGTFVNYNSANFTNRTYTCHPTACTTVVNIPDVNFKNYLIGNTAINTNSDTEIQCSEASAFSGAIIINGLVPLVTDFTGLEAFTSLTSFSSNGHILTTPFDVSNNTMLTSLTIVNAQLTSLDVSANVALTDLFCAGNQLSNLDLSVNTNLARLECDNNQLTTLDVSTNTGLTRINCNNNQITMLDISGNNSLQALFCGNNLLMSLNAANGNNSNISVGDFLAVNNSNLTCITVDNVAYSTTNWLNIDAQTSFSTNCTTLGIDDFILNNISIYPNPVSDILSIQIEEIFHSIEVYTLQGQKIIESTIPTISVSEFPSGLYILKVINSDGKVGLKRFVKK